MSQSVIKNINGTEKSNNKVAIRKRINHNIKRIRPIRKLINDSITTATCSRNQSISTLTYECYFAFSTSNGVVPFCRCDI